MGLGATFGQPFGYQVDFFRGKLNLPTDRWDDIWKSAHDRAFVVAGAAEADLLQDLRDAVDAAVSQGETLAQFRARFSEIVDKHGWHGWTGEDTQAGFDWRTKVIYNTNLRASYAAGRWQQLQEQAARGLTFWRYVHNDSVAHPRPLHQAWGDSRLTLPYDDPFWQTHFPPNGWGCRCRVVAERKPGPDAATTRPAGWNTTEDKTGEPPGIDKGWGYAPGANVDQTLVDLIDQKLIKLDAPIGAAMMEALEPALRMERQLAWYDTLAAWRSTGQVGAPRNFIVGALKPEILTWLKAERDIEPATAEVVVQDRLVLGPKERRHQNKTQDGFSDAEWRRLPEMIDKPESVLFDTRSGHLLYVLPVSGNVGQKLTVEFDYLVSRKPDVINNAIVSAYRQRLSDIEGEIKGGIWIKVN
jgi:hypothetical protein